MSDIADMIYQGVQQEIQKPVDIAGPMIQGAQLAQHAQQIEIARQQMEQQKQQLEMSKVDKLTSAMATGAAMKSVSARNAYFKNYIPGITNALGLQNFIPPETMAMIQADPEQAKKITLIKNQVMSGELSYSDALKKMSPEEFASIDDRMVEQMDAAAKFSTQQGNLDARTGKRLDQQQQKIDIGQQKEARAKADNDQAMKVYLPRLEGAAKIGELIQSAQSGKVVSNRAFLGQLNAEIARLETGSQSPGLGMSEKTELESSRANLQAFVDKVTGKPTDAVSPEILKSAGAMVNELQGSYTRGINSRMEFLKAGLAPQYGQILDQKLDVLKKTYAPRFGGKWGEETVGTPPPPPPPGKPPTNPLASLAAQRDALLKNSKEAQDIIIKQLADKYNTDVANIRKAFGL